MGYGFSTQDKTHLRSLIEVLHRFRWEFAKDSDLTFEGLSINLLLETAVDELNRLERIDKEAASDG